MGSGNNDFGYFSGGQTPSHVSTVDRVDYSNDTADAVEKGPLSSTATLGSATGNSSFGYVFGYYGGTSQRINYNNDTATALVKGDIIMLVTIDIGREQQVVKKTDILILQTYHQ